MCERFEYFSDRLQAVRHYGSLMGSRGYCVYNQAVLALVRRLSDKGWP